MKSTLLSKLERIEKKNMTDATVCNHLPPVVRYFEPDGTLDTTHGIPDETPCSCGRDRICINVNYTASY